MYKNLNLGIIVVSSWALKESDIRDTERRS